MIHNSLKNLGGNYLRGSLVKWVGCLINQGRGILLNRAVSLFKPFTELYAF